VVGEEGPICDWGGWLCNDQVLMCPEPSSAEMAVLLKLDLPCPPSKKPRTRSELKKERLRQIRFFPIARRKLGFMIPNPRTPYFKVITRMGLQCLFLEYRHASVVDILKPHLVVTEHGTFVLEANDEVLHHLLQFIPVDGIGEKEEHQKMERKVYNDRPWPWGA
jgi:hypothetical protein